jgi:Kef-type K+ transport system membrane component KefB
VRIWPALAADVICILVFAIVGRSSHAETTDLAGVLGTAWPFLAGYALALTLARSWRHPVARPSALILWASTVVVGMALRVLTGAGVQLSFVVVTAVVLAAFLLGWRTLWTLVQRARHSGHAAA